MAIGTSNLNYGLGTPGTGWPMVDVQDKILNIDPTESPFFEMIGTGSSQSIRHEWQTQGLESRAVQAVIEGADFTYQAMGTPTRLSNTNQIVMHGVEISGSAEAQPYYGARSAMKHELNRRMKEHRNAIEVSLIRAVETTGGNTAARRMDGLLAAAGVATTANNATLSESAFVSILETMWLNNTAPNTALVNTKLKNVINAYTGIGPTKYLDVTIRGVVNQVLTYSSDYGTINIYLCRDVTNSSAATNGVEMAVFDKTLLSKAYLRTSRMVRHPEGIVDGHRASLLTELTLEYGNATSIYWWRGWAAA